MWGQSKNSPSQMQDDNYLNLPTIKPDLSLTFLSTLVNETKVDWLTLSLLTPSFSAASRGHW